MLNAKQNKTVAVFHHLLMEPCCIPSTPPPPPNLMAVVELDASVLCVTSVCIVYIVVVVFI